MVSDQIASRANLVISEIMYNPPNPSAEELENGYDDADFFEYLELLNIGEEPLSLAGLQFISGLKFEFSGATISRLEPGERGLLVRDAVAFVFRYGGDAAARIIGEFTDDAGLANGGERLALIAADQSTVQDSATGPIPHGRKPLTVTGPVWFWLIRSAVRITIWH